MSKKHITTCFIDIDGVLANFVEGVFDLYGIPQNYVHQLRGNYDIISFLSVSVDSFWEKINRKSTFWEMLNLTDEAERIVELAEKYTHKRNVFLLSSPAVHPNCYNGKAAWVKEHFPDYMTRLILTGHKYLLAAPDRLLIDDSDRKLAKFQEHGGQTILIPRPWNSKHTNEENYPFIMEEFFSELELTLGAYKE
jgi:5'(3')-deoxyribonucleotidase